MEVVDSVVIIETKTNDDRIINILNKKNPLLINLFWFDYYLGVV